ncbi:hypothetical protein EJB05_22844, partial [Eragrostis curvula]
VLSGPRCDVRLRFVWVPAHRQGIQGQGRAFFLPSGVLPRAEPLFLLSDVVPAGRALRFQLCLAVRKRFHLLGESDEVNAEEEVHH